MSSLPFPTRLRFWWKHIGEITFGGDIPTELRCGPRCFLLVHCQVLVHCSSFNTFFQTAKRLIKGRGETVNNFVALEYGLLVHINLLECICEAILK
jgi:hypothetical protein